MARTKRSEQRAKFDYHLNRMMSVDDIVGLTPLDRRRVAYQRCTKLCQMMIRASVFWLDVTTCVKVVNFCIRHDMKYFHGHLLSNVVEMLEYHCTDGIKFLNDERINSTTSL